MSARAIHQMSSELQECITSCLECYAICLNSVSQCLQMGGRHAEAAHIRLLLDCTEICNTSADYMLRNSPLHTRICAVCAEVCAECATDCDRFEDEFMKSCAEACRGCAESCRRMATVH